MNDELTIPIPGSAYKYVVRVVKETPAFPSTVGIGYRARLIGPHGVIMEPHDQTKIGAIARLTQELKESGDTTSRKLGAAVEKELKSAIAKAEKEARFVEASKKAVELHAEVDTASATLQRYQRSSIGLVSDQIRLSPEYKRDKANYDLAFSKLRKFNTTYTKHFAKELAAERDKRRARSAT